jgi:hypothetical protein
MEFVMSPGGLLVHMRQDWPCAVCRSGAISESYGYCLCRSCAYAMVAAAGAGEEGARALLNEITEALSMLEAQRSEPRLVAN